MITEVINDMPLQHDKRKIGRTEFPILKNISQVRKAIQVLNEEVKNAFYEKEDTSGQYIYFNYKFFSRYTFPDPLTHKYPEYCYLLRECRGLVFEKSSGNIVSRSFHKFFGLGGPMEECDPKNMSLKDAHVFLEKKDGSMCIPLLIFVNEKPVIKFRTKMGYDTDLAKRIHKYVYENNHTQFVDLALEWIQKGWTPIFEYVAPDNRIVLEYDAEKLILLALRNVETGKYMSVIDVGEIAQKYHIETTEILDFGDDLDDALKKISVMKGKEGYVLRFLEDDRMFKIKTTWYRELHDSFTEQSIGNEKFKECDIWRMIIDQEIDDVIVTLQTNEMKDKVEKFCDTFWECVNNRIKEVETIVSNAREKNTTKKDFYELLQSEKIHRFGKKAGLRLFDSREDPFESFTKLLKQETLKSIPDDVREYLGGEIKLELHGMTSYMETKLKMKNEPDE